MLIIDAHLDLAWNALQWNRDLRQSVYSLRSREARIPGPGRGQNTVSFVELRRGHVALCFGTVIARVIEHGAPGIDYDSSSQAFGIAQGQLAYYHGLAEQGYVRLITNLALLDAHMTEWELWEKSTNEAQRRSDSNAGENVFDWKASPPTGIVISMECADPILAPSQIPHWFSSGLRVIGPGHYGRGRYVGGTGSDVGFNAEGIELLQAMERGGMILDVTHLSDEAFWQALDLFDGTILASHHNSRALVPHQRQLSDAQIRALVQRDAVIGAAFDMWMLIPDWSMGHSSNREAGIATVAEHIDHVCQIAGDSEHSGIGSDLDGGFGRESSPHNLDTIADVQHLAEALAYRGFDDAQIADIMYQNWWRLLRRAWGNHG